MTKKIIEKYERVLASRENQIADLASEIGIVSITFNSTNQYSILHNENILFQNKFIEKKKNFYNKNWKIKKF